MRWTRRPGASSARAPPLSGVTERIRHARVYAAWRDATRFFLGIHPHAVFMDARYGPYPQQLGIVYVRGPGDEIWLPVTSPLGHVGLYALGRQYVYWVHRVGGRAIQWERVADGVRRHTAFWANKHQVDLRRATFEVRARRLKAAEGWEAGLLHHQYAQPWATIATAVWSDRTFTLTRSAAPNTGPSRAVE